MHAVAKGANAPLSLVQDSAKQYYARGSGPAPLRGPADYAAFSKAASGGEAAYGLQPELVLSFGAPVQKWQGEQVGALPIAVALWRYVTPAHAYLPSVHEVVTGLWQPRAHEVRAGLGKGGIGSDGKYAGDFCTAAAAAVAVAALQSPAGLGAWAAPAQQKKALEAAKAFNRNDWPATALAGLVPAIADGSLAAAWRRMRKTLGLPEASVASTYDWTCRGTPAWPAPASSDPPAQPTWLVPDASTGKCTLALERPAAAGKEGYLSVWAEGDVARCW